MSERVESRFAYGEALRDLGGLRRDSTERRQEMSTLVTEGGGSHG